MIQGEIASALSGSQKGLSAFEKDRGFQGELCKVRKTKMLSGLGRLKSGALCKEGTLQASVEMGFLK